MENIALNSTSVLERQEVSALGDSPRTRSRLISMASGHASPSALQAKKETVKQVGSPTECALLEFAGDMGFDYQQIRNEKLLEETDVSQKRRLSSQCRGQHTLSLPTWLRRIRSLTHASLSTCVCL